MDTRNYAIHCCRIGGQLCCCSLAGIVGAIKACSLFAWCQSAAMGGGALGGLSKPLVLLEWRLEKWQPSGGGGDISVSQSG